MTLGEIKDARYKLSSTSSDFQTLIKHLFPLYFLNELLMSLRKSLTDTHKTQLKQFTPRQESKKFDTPSNIQQQLYWLYLRHEDFSTKTMTNEKSKIKVN